MDKTITNAKAFPKAPFFFKPTAIIALSLTLSMHALIAIGAELEQQETVKTSKSLQLSTVTIPQDLLEPISVEEATTNMSHMVKTIKFFYDPKFHQNIERREQKKPGGIAAYQHTLVLNGWNAQVGLQQYLRDLYSKAAVMITIIQQFQSIDSEQKKIIESVSEQHTKLTEENQTLLTENQALQERLIEQHTKLTEEKQTLLAENQALKERISELEQANKKSTLWTWLFGLFSRS